MGSLIIKRQHASGFTIIEIITVILVIGILASITLVVYPGYQMRTRNSERKSDVSQIATALSAYALQKNNYIDNTSGCGLDGSGNGWFNASSADVGSGSYNSIASCLVGVNLIKNGELIDPSGCKFNSGSCASPVQAYMKATCLKSGSSVTYVLAYLEGEPPKIAEVDGLCDSGTVGGFNATTQKWGSLYGMNYYVAVK